MCPKLRVLMSIRFDDELPNPYSKLFVDGLPSFVRPISFRWNRAILGRYDIFHVHWPEAPIRDPSRLKRLVKRILLLLLVARCIVLQTPIVRTVHNEAPHEYGGWIEAQLLRVVNRATGHWIVMNSSTRSPDGRPRYLVPHGHYRSWYEIPSNPVVRAGSVLFFGEIRPYKNVVGLCRAFMQLSRSNSDLRVMGRPASAEIEREIRDLVQDAENVQLDLTYVESSDLIAALAATHLVVLPYTRFHNSGAALLALSVGRPILVPACQAARELVDEFGDEYVRLFEGDLTAEVLGLTLRDARVENLPKPSMSGRDWRLLGRKVAEIYSAACERSERRVVQ